MQTVTIQIGNSDDKLTQTEWAHFISDTRDIIGKHCGQVHFDGGSKFDSIWQNVCIVADVYDPDKKNLLADIQQIRMVYRQDSVAVCFGVTEFV